MVIYCGVNEVVFIELAYFFFSISFQCAVFAAVCLNVFSE